MGMPGDIEQFLLAINDKDFDAYLGYAQNQEMSQIL